MPLWPLGTERMILFDVMSEEGTATDSTSGFRGVGETRRGFISQVVMTLADQQYNIPGSIAIK